MLEERDRLHVTYKDFSLTAQGRLALLCVIICIISAFVLLCLHWLISNGA